MTSLCRHLSAQEIVNWVTTADGCVHTDDTTNLSPTSCEFVFTPPTPTRQNSFVPSAVCIGHKSGVGFVCYQILVSSRTSSLYSKSETDVHLTEMMTFTFVVDQ